MNNRLISVVIPAFNAEKTISGVITAVLNQDYPGKIELFVVDDGSRDSTGRIAQTFSGVKYIKQQNAGPAAARNRGFKESQGEIVFFTDSDCVPEKNWISKSLDGFSRADVAVVAGSYGIVNGENLLARVIHKEIFFRHSTRMPDFPKSFGSYNFSVKRKIFEQLGGFDVGYPFASGEDNDLSYKILKAGYKIYFSKDSIVNHFHQTVLTRYLFEQFRHGFWRVKMYLDHPSMTTGDDYTYWKDILEPFLVLFYLCSILCGAFGIFWGLKISLMVLAGHFIFEVFYGFLITKSIYEGLFLGWVMFLRSFSRTLGFLLGFLRIFVKKSSKKR